MLEMRSSLPLLSCPPFNHELVRHLYIGVAAALGSKKEQGASDLVLQIKVPTLSPLFIMSNELMTFQRMIRHQFSFKCSFNCEGLLDT